MNSIIENWRKIFFNRWGAVLPLLAFVFSAHAQTCDLGSNGAASGQSFQLQGVNSTVGVTMSAASTYGEAARSRYRTSKG